MRNRSTPLALVLLLACSCAKGGNGPGAGSGTGGRTGGDTTGGTGGGGNPNTGSDVQPGLIEAPPGSVANFTNKQVHLIGRINPNVTGGALLSWPATGVQLRVIGASTVSLSMQGQQWGQFNSLAVLIDGKLTQTVKIVDTATVYPLRMPDTQAHDLLFIKRNEAGLGQILLSQVTTDGRFVDPTVDPTRLIEFVGDTLTVGYGIDGPAGNATCVKAANVVADPNFENAAESFAVQTAQALGADWSVMAMTSRGLTVNLDGSRGLTMADVYTRQNPFDVNSPNNYKPQAKPAVVVVGLGTQDINYWLYHQVATTVNTTANATATVGPVARDPTGFVAAYTAMVKAIRANNPQASVILTIGPTLSKYQCFNSGTYANGGCVDASGATQPSTLSLMQSMVQSVVAAVNDPKVTSLEYTANSTDISCDYAPSLAGHQKMAVALIAAIKAATGWSGPALPAPNTDAQGVQTVRSPNPTFVKPDLSGDPNVTGIDPDQYPWCQVCSPSLYDTTLAACPTPIGTSLPCQSYCHMVTPILSETPWASEPPVSGNHDPVPEAVLGEHATPVGRGHYIHSMEHGAIVIAYNCPSGCDSELATLRATIAQRPPPALVIMTPDPLLNSGTRFAAMSWTWTYTFDAPVQSNLLCFIDQHMYFGRECNPNTKVCTPLTSTAMAIPGGGG